MRLAGVMACVLATACMAAADVLETRDGRLLEGVYRGGTQQAVRFEVGDQVQVVPLDQVLALTFDARSAPVAKAPASTPDPAPRPAPTERAAELETPTPEAPVIARIPAGTKLRVRVVDAIDPRQTASGDRFAATLETGLAADHTVVAPVGSKVYGRVAEVRSTGPVASRLKLELNQLMLQGQLFEIVTGPHQVAPEEEEAGPAKASTIPVRPGFAPGTRLEFRLLQPFEVRIR